MRRAEKYGDAAKRARDSFNQRFWFADGGYLFDVVDCNGQSGTTDSSCRPNQIFAISLEHPVLEQKRWSSVVEVVAGKIGYAGRAAFAFARSSRLQTNLFRRSPFA